ncbi:hypothetical protein HRbin07_00535 [bacterium HR07]|uniref:Uncharacterized protein n=1 Tax=Acetithermum autotrophicum TaxID=1446466 RepID=H5SQY0_ACEAU|nr:hypothetical protein HGMM_OP2C047 [Candidatus Acetothermum autotrophicum]GBC76336.1 hypothetical protein HRbin07_00535 [bacterium HR07]
MPLALQELVEFIESFGYKVSAPSTPTKGSVVDALLGAFAGALPEGQSSTEHIKELRETTVTSSLRVFFIIVISSFACEIGVVCCSARWLGHALTSIGQSLGRGAKYPLSPCSENAILLYF